jgi:sugar phosphate isomerase/epimerase
MCIKDFDMVPRDGERKRDVALTPGSGRVDFAEVLRKLRGGGSTSGYLVVECLDRAADDRNRLLAEARKARRFVEQIVAEVTGT